MSNFVTLRTTCRRFDVATRHCKDVVLSQFLSKYCLPAPDTYSVPDMRDVKCLASIPLVCHHSLINPRHQPHTESEPLLHLTKLGPSIRAFCICVAGRKWPDNAHKRK